MLIIGTFEHSLELEQALTILEQNGISRKYIMVVPMSSQPETTNPNINKSNDFINKGMEVGIACAAACSVIGTSIGFILDWGPIIWGLLFAFIAFIVGFSLFYIFNLNTHSHLPKKLPEVIVIVQCEENQSLHVMELMWKYRVLTVGKFNNQVT